MKRRLILAFYILFALTGIQSVSAQMAGSQMLSEKPHHTPDYKKHCFATDLSVGKFARTDGVALDLGIRYLYNFSPYIGWDAIGMKVMTTSDFENALIQFMTGIRGTSPQFGKLSLYSNFRLGYGGLGDDSFEGGFCFEFGLGVNFAKRFHTGYVYDRNNYLNGSNKCNSIQFGITF